MSSITYDMDTFFPSKEDGTIIRGKNYLIYPKPEKGFNFGYMLYIPEGCNIDTTLIVHGINTGGLGMTKGKIDHNKGADTLEEGEEVAKIDSLKANEGVALGADLKMPVLTPLIPRIKAFNTHSLSSMVYNDDISYLKEFNASREDDNKLSVEQLLEVQEKCRDIPLQVTSMIKDAGDFLSTIGVNIDDKVIVEGYSGGAKFANLFTALHPNIVKACIGGGTSGLGILPMPEMNGQELKYPLGVSDIPNFDLEAFRKVPQYYYMGEQDDNDPAEVITSDTGEIMPAWPESYTPSEVRLIHTLLGSNIQNRFDNNKRAYEEKGVNATFQKFYGDHYTVVFLQDIKTKKYIIHEQIKEFINKVLEKELVDSKQILL